MLLGDIAYLSGFLVPEVAVALLFYWWYSTKRRPDVIASDSKSKRHRVKAVVFSVLIFLALFALAANGVKSSVVTWKVGKCVSTSGEKVTGYSSCSGNHFAKVIAIVKAKDNCPASSTNVLTEASTDSSPGWTVCLDSNL